MALTLVINGGEDYQAGDITTAQEGVISTAGVFNVPGGGFLVTQNGTPNKSVNVAAGYAQVPNSAYSLGSGGARYWPFRSSATENVTIPDNASGNPRIDKICLKVDTGASAGVRGVGAASVVCVQGTPAASPSAPATPNDHLELAQVAVANGFTSITNANITDTRVEATLKFGDGWQYLGNNGAYQSADDPTYVIRFTSVDMTPYISVGMRIRLKQGGSYKYFIVTAIAFSTHTDMTVYGGTDYDLANSAITDLYFSSSKAPYGFPVDPTKWTVKVTDTITRSTSATTGTFYNLGSVNITIPIGAWQLDFTAFIRLDGGSAAANVQGDLALSTSTSSISDKELASTVFGLPLYCGATLFRQKDLVLASKTTYYLISKASWASVNGMTLYNMNADNTAVLRATCAYL